MTVSSEVHSSHHMRIKINKFSFINILDYINPKSLKQINVINGFRNLFLKISLMG